MRRSSGVNPPGERPGGRGPRRTVRCLSWGSGVAGSSKKSNSISLSLTSLTQTSQSLGERTVTRVTAAKGLLAPNAKELLMAPAADALSSEQLVLGRFRPLRPLGSGGSGSVWLALDEQRGAEVALKIVARDGKAGPRAEREAAAAARL